MIKKKVCIVGAFAVGKSSLIKRFVHSLYSDVYLTTVGVKIDKKQVQVEGQDIQFLLWDIQGEDQLSKLNLNYLRGASAIILVIDGTRQETLSTALSIKSLVDETSNKPVISIALINKSDLSPAWEIDDEAIAELGADGMQVMRTSAKEDSGVEEAFTYLARIMLEV